MVTSPEGERRHRFLTDRREVYLLTSMHQPQASDSLVDDEGNVSKHQCVKSYRDFRFCEFE
jgi:hypothetical protein